MGNTIRIKAGEVVVSAELNNSNTAQSIWEALPIKGKANCWGDEIYFRIPVELGTEDGKEVVEIGDLAYWAPGNAFCIFFGPTPASHGNEIRPASAVTIFGKITGDATVFRRIRSASPIVIEKEDTE